MADISTPDSIHDLPLALIKNMVSLASSGFGVVVALAWNEVIRQTVETYIDPWLGKGSGLVSLLIYAIVVTVLAVVVTMQLSGLQKNMEKIEAKLNAARDREGAASD